MSTTLALAREIHSHFAAAPAACDASVNPFCGVTPSFDAFGIEFKGKMQMFLGGLWGLVLAVTAASLLLGVGRYAYAAKRSHNSSDLAAGSEQIQRGAIAFGAAVGISILLGAVIFLVQ